MKYNEQLNIIHKKNIKVYKITIQIMDGIICIPKVLEFHKSETIFQHDVPDPSVTFQEVFNVVLPSPVGEATDVYAGF